MSDIIWEIKLYAPFLLLLQMSHMTLVNQTRDFHLLLLKRVTIAE